MSCVGLRGIRVGVVREGWEGVGMSIVECMQHDGVGVSV